MCVVPVFVISLGSVRFVCVSVIARVSGTLSQSVSQWVVLSRFSCRFSCSFLFFVLEVNEKRK